MIIMAHIYLCRAHIVWRKDHEELRKSEKYKINKKGALKIVDINLPDSGVYSCWGKSKKVSLYFASLVHT